MMNDNVFDRIAPDYEKIHNQSLPPGIQSLDFIVHRAARAAEWILDRQGEGVFSFLDFGCGNGRMLKLISQDLRLKPLLEEKRLRLFGFDTSRESLGQAGSLMENKAVTLLHQWNRLPLDVRFDFIMSCHVFHHVPIRQRVGIARDLHGKMKPGANLVIWEHNPFNPATRFLVRACPFDRDARLLTAGETIDLFSVPFFRAEASAYVHFFPPQWLNNKAVRKTEKLLGSFPGGAQYWVMFRRT